MQQLSDVFPGLLAITWPLMTRLRSCQDSDPHNDSECLESDKIGSDKARPELLQSQSNVTGTEGSSIASFKDQCQPGSSESTGSLSNKNETDYVPSKSSGVKRKPSVSFDNEPSSSKIMKH